MFRPGNFKNRPKKFKKKKIREAPLHDIGETDVIIGCVYVIFANNEENLFSYPCNLSSGSGQSKTKNRKNPKREVFGVVVVENCCKRSLIVSKDNSVNLLLPSLYFYKLIINK